MGTKTNPITSTNLHARGNKYVELSKTLQHEKIVGSTCIINSNGQHIHILVESEYNSMTNAVAYPGCLSL